MILPLLFAAVVKWYESYYLGVSAVRAKNYDAGAEALSKAIAEMPSENGSIRAGNQIITYTPHFWLGIAKFNQNDLDGALREWKISEDQGVVQTTPYYAQLRDWVARANAEKQRRAEGAAAGSKRDANAAVGKALSAQMDAVAAGADRSDGYRAAQRKLQEALDTNAKGGTDVRTYKRASDLADQARELFVAAADDAKKKKAARPPAVARVQPQPKPVEVTVPMEPVPAPVPAPVAVQPQPAAPQPQPAPVQVESEASVAARIAAQNERRKKIEGDKKPDGGLKPAAPQAGARAPLEAAWRAYAAGELAASDRQLTQLIDVNGSAEAYLLRGCARYTQAMLSRDGQAKLNAAAADFREALTMNKALRLDRSAFSPKLVAYFESISSARPR